MTENDKLIALRLMKSEKDEILFKINEIDNKKKEILKLKKEINELEKNKIVQKYLDLIKTYNFLEELYSNEIDEKNYKNLKKQYENILLSLKNKFDPLERMKIFSSCTHPLKVYQGSYSGEFVRSVGLCMIDNEDNKKFRYNIYTCVECNSRESVFGDLWKEYESKNKVLKSYPPHDLEEVRNAYFALLQTSIPTNKMADEIILKFTRKK